VYQQQAWRMPSSTGSATARWLKAMKAPGRPQVGHARGKTLRWPTRGGPAVYRSRGSPPALPTQDPSVVPSSEQLPGGDGGVPESGYGGRQGVP